jgi:hypothetical protein
MNTMTVKNVELDGETVDAIVAADGREVSIQILMNTPRRGLTWLEARARFDSDTDAILMAIPEISATQYRFSLRDGNGHISESNR